MIFQKRNVKLDVLTHSKNDALKQIAKFAYDLGYTSNEQKLFEAFVKRENEVSTGFEYGFAIPHAKTSVVKQPQILFCRFVNPVDWIAIDHQLTKHVFVLLIPENADNEHLEILSQVAKGLMNAEFISKLTTTDNAELIYYLISDYLELNLKNNHPSKNITTADTFKTNKQKIIALTACPVGIAHTYLAAEKLEQAATQLGYEINVETHGSAGTKNLSTEKAIEVAEVIIVAADIGLDLQRFKNKRIYQTNTKYAINDPQSVINNALKQAKVLVNNSSDETILKDSLKSQNSSKKSFFMKHLLSGISYMVPFVILGGIAIALSAGIGKGIYGEKFAAPTTDFLFYLGEIGAVAFNLMIGILGAYIAYSIAGRSAIAPAFIVAIVANTPRALFRIGDLPVETAMGFLGSILFGFTIGYTVKWINSWILPKPIMAIVPIFVIPLGVGLFYGLIAIFVIGAPIGFVLNEFSNSLKKVFTSNNGNNLTPIGIGIGMGILIGAMAGFDMGGPVNKIAFLTSTALITQNILEPMGMMAAAIPVAPLGMGTCTLIFRHKFDDNEKTLGVSAIVMGLIGISEGAIPFAISDPKRAIISNIVGSAVAGAIAGAFGVTDAAAHGGPIVAILGAIGSNRPYGVAGGIGFFFLAIIIGLFVTALMYGFLRKNSSATNQTKPTPVKKLTKSKTRFSWFSKNHQLTQLKTYKKRAQNV